MNGSSEFHDPTVLSPPQQKAFKQVETARQARLTDSLDDDEEKIFTRLGNRKQVVQKPTIRCTDWAVYTHTSSFENLNFEDQ